MGKTVGKVYIVGAGPGNVAYLTVRGEILIKQAEVILYDALVDQSVLKLIPVNCEKIDVGKRGKQNSFSQAEINNLLVEKCLAGKRVVRLKGGDPFIFGRTTGEIEALRENQCDWEIVPGVSSALAAPLLAGIPLTDAVMSRYFLVLTADDIEILDWQRISEIDTLVILMGGNHLQEIVQQLLRHERTPDTPVAIVHHCATPEQKTWVSNLANITDTVREQIGDYPLSPCVIIVGEVVGLRKYLQFSHSFEPVLAHESFAQADQPLRQQTILVTRAADQSSQFTDLLQQRGATVLEMPALVISDPSDWQPLDRAIAQIETFDWLILTSSNGVDYFCRRLMELQKDSRHLAHLKIAVVGKKTAASLASKCLQPDFIPPDFIADSLVANFPESLAGKKILFPRVESGGREILVQEMTAQGAIVIEAPAYQSGCPQNINPEVLEALQNHRVNILTFASSKTVKNFWRLIEENLSVLPEDWLDSIAIASIGPQTSESCQTFFGKVDIEAKEYTLDGLTQAIVQWLG
jgi:uroporphyrinogen III methyltransferase/synthase